MKLTKEQQEKLVMAIQAAAGLLIIGMSIVNSAQVQSKAMKKHLAKEARRAGKLKKKEYGYQKKLLAQKYRKKLAKGKKGLRQQSGYGKIK